MAACGRRTTIGRTWRPIFDDQDTGSIGTVAVAPSDPNVIYVGSGEGLQRPDLSVGDGMYKSTDAGKTWRHLGLRDAQQIPAILVDPRNPNRLFVAALGHPYGPNAERGVFRSTDGGQTFQKVLYKDELTGAIDLAFDPRNPQTVYAVLWQAQQGPWENGAFGGPNSGLYQSTDGGTTWKAIGSGLPTFAKDALGRIGIGIAPSDGNRIYALVEARGQAGGLYRSDDAGATFRKVNGEQRVYGRGNDFACVAWTRKIKEVVYVANTSTYKSTDAGQSFTAIKGAPGGDDYHTIWINPLNPAIILLAADQGATITVNGGATWSSWYNQPTAQFYHVITDNQLPYWVYGGQQESGSAGVASRGNDGQITFRDWHPVGAEEYGYVAPDPLNPNIVYGGKVTRYNKVTGEVKECARAATTATCAPCRCCSAKPIRAFCTWERRWCSKPPTAAKTGRRSRPTFRARPTSCRPAWRPIPRRRSSRLPGAAWSIRSRLRDCNVNVLWAGTDDGLIHVTRDGGKTWKNVTPPGVTPWSKIAQLDASHFDDDTVYAAVNRLRVDDLKPHIWRTHDGGATWKETVRGLPDGPVNAVREDPVRKGLLFAGTELAVFVSFNDGDDWQPLRLNMPATSIRDLVVHEDDLVVGTHGRGFWILDDISPLRQLTPAIAAGGPHLFAPRPVWRFNRNTNTDTPLPPEEPAGKNPPDGAILYYWLPADAKSPVTLEILDSTGKMLRKYSSADKPEPPNPTLNVPSYWIRPPVAPPATAGMHRFVWDLHAARRRGRCAGASAASTRFRRSTWIRRERRANGCRRERIARGCTVDGQVLTQELVVRPDPRR